MSISVVIPVRNAEATLHACLESLFFSKLQPDECIVVDDGSTDRSAQVAALFNVRLIRNTESRGPAHARNLGASLATQDTILFIDSDVCVLPSTLEKIAATFDRDPGLTGLIGAYDSSPASPEVVSRYRNLLHHYVHRNSSDRATTFWTGCGAVRRLQFLASGGFDESYSRPSIEDIELGVRLTQMGYTLRLDASIQVRHLKRWTFWDVVKCDIFHRGMPWTELILRTGRMPNDLNIQLQDRFSVAAVTLAIPAGLAALAFDGISFLAPALAALFLLLMRLWVDEALPAGRLGSSMVMFSMLTATIVLSLWQGTPILPVLVTSACLLYLLRNWVGKHIKPLARPTGIFCGLFTFVALIICAAHLPASAFVIAFGTLLLFVVALNYPFYLFLIEHWGGLYCLAAIPLHLLFYLHCAIGFSLGALRYYWRLLQGSGLPAARSPLLPAGVKAAPKRTASTLPS